MSEFSVRIEHLPAMRVARFQSVSAAPEAEAWEQLRNWTEPRNLLRNIERHPVFGFNNPAPAAGTREYGYEFWIGLDPADEVGREVATLAFPGGWYAVSPLRGLPSPDAWMRLWKWVRRSPVRHRVEHELERLLNPLATVSDWAFELYLPIEAVAEPDPDADATAAESIELATVRAFIATINAHDVDALAALMTDDHTFVDSAGTTVSGRDEMARGWRLYLSMFPDYAVRIESVLQDGAVVAVFGSWSATYAGKCGFVPDNAVGGPAAWRALVEDARIKTWQVYADHTRTIEVINRDAGLRKHGELGTGPSPQITPRKKSGGDE